MEMVKKKKKANEEKEVFTAHGILALSAINIASIVVVSLEEQTFFL